MDGKRGEEAWRVKERGVGVQLGLFWGASEERKMRHEQRLFHLEQKERIREPRVSMLLRFFLLFISVTRYFFRQDWGHNVA